MNQKSTKMMKFKHLFKKLNKKEKASFFKQATIELSRLNKKLKIELKDNKRKNNQHKSSESINSVIRNNIRIEDI